MTFTETRSGATLPCPAATSASACSSCWPVVASCVASSVLWLPVRLRDGLTLGSRRVVVYLAPGGRARARPRPVTPARCCHQDGGARAEVGVSAVLPSGDTYTRLAAPGCNQLSRQCLRTPTADGLPLPSAPGCQCFRIDAQALEHIRAGQDVFRAEVCAWLTHANPSGAAASWGTEMLLGERCCWESNCELRHRDAACPGVW